jgi:iron(III) transport system ATP-binding protein
MVFQDYALFPHLTVAGNIGFGLSKLARAQRNSRIDEMLTLVGLASSARKFPHELSGGQQQRVALARALAPKPALILLDEPFSNLDVDLREHLSNEVRTILKAQGATAVFVTHDQHEAFLLADQIGVINEGHMEQWDNAYTLYHEPATRFVADFIGQGVLMPGYCVADDQIQLELGTMRAKTCGGHGELDPHCQVDVLIRPDDIVHDDASPVQAEVLAKAFRGADILYTLRLSSGGKVLSLVPSHHNHAIGEHIGIRVEADHVVTFRRD